MQKGTYLTWVHRCRREHNLHGYIDADMGEHNLHGYIDAEGNIPYMGT